MSPRAPSPASRAHRPSVRGRWVAWLVVLMIFPGAREALTDLGHLVLDGHVAHGPCFDEPAADHDPERAPIGRDEHGCSGLFHTCRCCPATVVLAPVIARALRPVPVIAPEGVAWVDLGLTLDAHGDPPFRPPAA
ncbi:MAG: hypothetical protein IT385_13425 [Deltaproteobacteria bacterium]|nr:hypothetical protein [Deltaproteobacteria bacterium]